MSNILSIKILNYNVAVQCKKQFIINNISKDEKVILDAGCGIGYFMDIFYKKGKEVHGIDIDTECVKYVQGLRNWIVKNEGIEKTSYPNSSFDAIICSEVLEHIHEPEKAIIEFHRLLGYQGILILTTPSLDGFFKITKTCHEEGMEEHHVEGYSQQQLVLLLESNGFKVEKKSYCMVFFSNIWMEIIKQVYKKRFKQYYSQYQLIKENDSILFKLWKTFFFIPTFFIWIDEYLSHYFPGSMNLIKAKKVR